MLRFTLLKSIFIIYALFIYDLIFLKFNFYITIYLKYIFFYDKFENTLSFNKMKGTTKKFEFDY